MNKTNQINQINQPRESRLSRAAILQERVSYVSYRMSVFVEGINSYLYLLSTCRKIPISVLGLLTATGPRLQQKRP
jgi:hypothetical protein